MKPLRIAVTPGEPAGIGPDITLKIAQKSWPHQLVSYCDPTVLQQRAKQLGLPITLKNVDLEAEPTPNAAAELSVYPVNVASPVIPGQLNVENAQYVLNCLENAIAHCNDKHCAAMVTGPVNKAVINDAGITFSGHTEFLAQKTNVKQVVMMLASTQLRVALATTHLPLKAVAENITQDNLENTISILYHDLRNKFGISSPRIHVLGLNPHAGEGGHMGNEEIETIIPVLERLRQKGWQLHGPLPADTAFNKESLAQCDVVLAMYHDQGLPVLKYQSFGQTSNITLGLPIIRTSVDHGTALTLSGSGKANESSLQTAINTAIDMTSAGSI